MHNVKRFLQDAVFEPSQEARARAAADGNTRPEDMIPIYRKRTTIDPSGRETETQARCVRLPEKQSSGELTASQILCRRRNGGTGKVRCGRMGSCGVCYDDRPGLAI